MRKFLYSFLSLILVITLFLAGCDCSCASTQPLAFTTQSFGNSSNILDAPVGYTETLVYDVNYSKDYNAAFAKNPAISDKVVKFEYNNGKLITILEAHPIGKLTQDGIQSNIPNSLDDSAKTIYKLTTKFSIDVTFEIFNGKESKVTTFTDTVDSVVYFCSAKVSYAPLYSQSIKANHVLLYSENQATVNNIFTETYSYYHKNGYSVKTVNRDKPASEPDSKITSTVSSSHEYDFRMLIDNEQLLFVLRNFNVAGGNTSVLQTVLPAYGESQPLGITNNKTITKTIQNLQYNGGEKTNEEIQVRDISFKLSKTENSGMQQFVQIQQAKSTSGTVLNNAFITEYAQPLIAYGSIVVMGSLVSTLSSVNIYNPQA